MHDVCGLNPAYGFEYNGSFFFAPRYLSHIYMIAFDKDDWDEARRARELFDVLVREAAAEGYGEYRAHLDCMDLVAEQYDFNDGAMGRFNARIKAALDPEGTPFAGQTGDLAGRNAVVAVEGDGACPMSTEVLFAGELASVSDLEMARALESLNMPCGRLTIAVVAVPHRVLGYGLPFCGVALIEQPHDELERDAQRRACRVAATAPECVRVEHLVVGGWRDLVCHVERRGYDEVVVWEPPSRLVDRWLVGRTGWSIERGTPRLACGDDVVGEELAQRHTS
jgi:hypothetical protein